MIEGSTMTDDQLDDLHFDVDPLEPRALKLLIGDNEVEHLGVRDDRALTGMLKEIFEQDADGLLGTGYDDQMLANLVFVTRPQSEIEDFDAAAEWVGMPEYDTGELEIRLNILFLSQEDVDDLLQRLGVDRDTAGIVKKGRFMTMWWPPKKQKDDMGSLRFEEMVDGA